MLDQMKAKAKEGADKAERMAKSTKLKAEILVLENKRKTFMMEFGKDVYPAMAAGDRATTETLFMTTKSKVEALEADIAHKREQIESLKMPGLHAGMAGMSVGPPPGGPPSVGPPSGDPPLPPGWKSTLPPPTSITAVTAAVTAAVAAPLPPAAANQPANLSHL